MAKFGAYGIVQEGIRLANKAWTSGVTATKATITYLRELPKVMKQSVAIVSATTFIFTAILTAVVLAPDLKDEQRQIDLNQQYSALKAKGDGRVN